MNPPQLPTGYFVAPSTILPDMWQGFDWHGNPCTGSYDTQEEAQWAAVLVHERSYSRSLSDMHRRAIERENEATRALLNMTDTLAEVYDRGFKLEELLHNYCARHEIGRLAIECDPKAFDETGAHYTWDGWSVRPMFMDHDLGCPVTFGNDWPGSSSDPMFVELEIIVGEEPE